VQAAVLGLYSTYLLDGSLYQQSIMLSSPGSNVTKSKFREAKTRHGGRRLYYGIALANGHHTKTYKVENAFCYSEYFELVDIRYSTTKSVDVHQPQSLDMLDVCTS
jgi:hypothetical protein